MFNYLYNGLLFTYEAYINNVALMDEPRDYHTRWSKSDRERQVSHDMTYMWNLKNDTHELINKTETDSQT